MLCGSVSRTNSSRCLGPGVYHSGREQTRVYLTSSPESWREATQREKTLENSVASPDRAAAQRQHTVLGKMSQGQDEQLAENKGPGAVHPTQPEWAEQTSRTLSSVFAEPQACNRPNSTHSRPICEGCRSGAGWIAPTGCQVQPLTENTIQVVKSIAEPPTSTEQRSSNHPGSTKATAADITTTLRTTGERRRPGAMAHPEEWTHKWEAEHTLDRVSELKKPNSTSHTSNLPNS